MKNICRRKRRIFCGYCQVFFDKKVGDFIKKGIWKSYRMGLRDSERLLYTYGGNMVKEIVMMDYASVVCVLCLIIFILTNHYINKRIRMLFLVACVLSLCLVFVDSVEYWTASFSTMSPLRISRIPFFLS